MTSTRSNTNVINDKEKKNKKLTTRRKLNLIRHLSNFKVIITKLNSSSNWLDSTQLIKFN